jgi:hypothetical protein
MHLHAGKNWENQSKAAANRFSPNPSRSNVSAQLKDNRPAALTQLKLQEMAAQRVGAPEEEELLQGKFEPVQRVGGPEEEELLQGKFEPVQRVGGPEEEELLQGKFEPVQRVGGPEEEELLQGKFEPVQKKENNTGMPDNLKSGIEALSGLDMSDVRVHQNSSQPAQLNALAYAQGTDIHIAPGQDQHLAHEAWHVAQQKQGRVQPTMSLNGQNINDDHGLEHEADVMGAKAMQMMKDKVD